MAAGSASSRQRLLLPLILAAMTFIWPSLAHAEPKYYYCFAPDVATDTVYLSPVLPVGPIPERSKYGTKFAEYLQSRNLTTALIQAYCVMRETPEQIDHAQRALAVESCPECGGISRFQHVPMGGVGKAVLAQRPLPRPTTPRDPTTSYSDIPYRPPLIVIMGNDITGDILYALGGDDPMRAALEKTQQAGGEWTPIYKGRLPHAFVSMACTTEGKGTSERVLFFVGESMDGRDALNQAEQRATDAAADNGSEVFRCGRTMVKVNDDYEPSNAPQFSIIDWVKGMIRKQVIKNYGCQSDDEEKKPEPASCPRLEKKTYACMCVRG